MALTVLDQTKASVETLNEIKFPTSSGWWPVPGYMGLGSLMLAASAIKRVKVTKTYADFSKAAFTNTVTLLELPAAVAGTGVVTFTASALLSAI